MVSSTKINVPCSGCSTDPCYHWPYCTELLSLRAEHERLKELYGSAMDSLNKIDAENGRLRAAARRVLDGWDDNLPTQEDIEALRAACQP